jgi:Biotin carboxylase
VIKRLLVIGASVLQLPAIIKAKEMGFYVGTVDYNENAIGVKHADEFYCVSTIDEHGVYESAKKFRADGIVTLATDMPMRSVAYACEKLNLVGITYDTAIKCTDKGEMIKAFEAGNVAHPWYFIVNEPDELELISDKLTYPCISKPTDNSGSRGVILINNLSELREAVRYSSDKSRKGSIIIEEYLSGREVSVEVIVYEGVAYVLQVTDKLTTGAPYFVEMGHSQPSALDKSGIEAIEKLAAQAVIAVGIDNSPAHVEIMLTENGPKMIELGSRMGGDCITTHLVPLSTGIDMIKATIQIALGETPDLTEKLHCGSAIRYINAPRGYISSISGIEDAESIDGVREVVILKQANDYIDNIHSSTDRIGFVIAQNDTSRKAIESCVQAMDAIEIKIERAQ